MDILIKNNRNLKLRPDMLRRGMSRSSLVCATVHECAVIGWGGSPDVMTQVLPAWLLWRGPHPCVLFTEAQRLPARMVMLRIWRLVVQACEIIMN